MELRKKHRRTLEAVFARPIRASVRWRDVEALLIAVGATIRPGKGSHVMVALGSLRATLPLPKKGGGDLDKGALADVRDLLRDAGIRPDTTKEKPE